MSEDLDDALAEWHRYHGTPKCQDCGWKLGSMLTDNCSCLGPHSPEQAALYQIAYDYARKLQALFPIE